MDWDDLKVFLAVARAGQLLGGARTLGLNHATVARRIDQLEAAFGAKLFLRHTNGSRLTPEGEQLLTHAERVESEILASLSTIGSTGESVSGTVRIGAPDGFGVGILARRLPELAVRHPGLRVELVPVPRSFSLSRREADVAITVERPRRGRLVAEKLANYSLSLYGSRAYLAAAGPLETVADLRQHRLVGYVEDLIYSAALEYTDEVFRGWQSHLAISTAIGQAEAVAGGGGIGLLHDFVAGKYPELQLVLPTIRLHRAYWIAVHEDLRKLRRVAVVVEFLRQLASEGLG